MNDLHVCYIHVDIFVYRQRHGCTCIHVSMHVYEYLCKSVARHELVYADIFTHKYVCIYVGRHT